jgi:hypothetical protein
VSLRIAFDVDGVVADMNRAVAKRRASPDEAMTLERRLLSIENFWETLDELEPGAVARLAKLASQQRWDIVFLTDRPQSAGLPVQVQTQRWLSRHGFPLPSVLAVSKVNRGKLASVLRLDVVVDDRPENCVDVATESTARAVLMSASPEPSGLAFARRLEIQVVRSMSECLDVLQAWDASSRGVSRIVGQVRQLLGLDVTTSPTDVS